MCSPCVRPESIDLLPDTPTEPQPGRNIVHGEVREVVILGAARHVLFELSSGRVLLAVEPNRARAAFSPGQSILASFPAEGCILVPSAAASSAS